MTQNYRKNLREIESQKLKSHFDFECKKAKMKVEKIAMGKELPMQKF